MSALWLVGALAVAVGTYFVVLVLTVWMNAR